MFFKSEMEELLEQADFSKETNQKERLHIILFGTPTRSFAQDFIPLDNLAMVTGGARRSMKETVCPLCGGEAELTEENRHRCKVCGHEW